MSILHVYSAVIKLTENKHGINKITKAINQLYKKD